MTQAPVELRPSGKYGAVAVGNWLGMAIAGHKVGRHDTVLLTHLMTLQSYAPSHMNSRGTDDRRHKRDVYGTEPGIQT
jgi:hypothetical protein